MPSFSTLRRCSPFTQRFRTLSSSTSQSSSSPSPRRNPSWASGLAIVAGVASALALFYCYNSPTSPFHSVFFNNIPRSSSLPLTLPETAHGLLVRDAYRAKVFFYYEKRLRLHSSPLKVFEYFASCRTPEGEILMKPSDLMRAVVPVFPPSESNLVREGYLKGERDPGHLWCPPSDFFMLFDVDNDGLISFKEYIFFVTLLSIPESSFSAAFKMFDKDNDGSGSPSMENIETFSAAYREKLDEAELAKSVPDNLCLEVSSPGVERIVRIPDDLDRFKDRPMYVKYVISNDPNNPAAESEGVFMLESFDLETKCCTWGLADVKVNRQKSGKGRPLNKKQREWRLSIPFDSLRFVRLHSDI